jgi:hypothetical protein
VSGRVAGSSGRRVVGIRGGGRRCRAFFGGGGSGVSTGCFGHAIALRGVFASGAWYGWPIFGMREDSDSALPFMRQS